VTQQGQHNYDYASPPKNNYANTDPNMAHQAHQVPHRDAYSTADVDGRNRGAQAGNVAANAAGHNQKAGTKGKKVDAAEIKRLVDEENTNQAKLPRYPGLERWELLEKMGDGAFSNVYRARDLEGDAGEVAIKVVRKFEMNSNQVSIGRDLVFPSIPSF
jgi:serine/threonine-protein kinase RCK2